MSLLGSVNMGALPVAISTALAGLLSYVYFTAIRPPSAELDVSRVRALAALAAPSSSTSSSGKLLQGKVAIVTGSTSGIGQEIALQLYQLGCTVIIASRSPAKCALTAEHIRSTACFAPGGEGGRLEVLPLDTCDLDNVAAFAAQVRKQYAQLHFLVNNAGMMYVTNMVEATAESPLRSPQGYDQAFATNFLGHFLLTELLLPLLRSTPGARVLQIASSVHLQVNGEALRPTSPTSAPTAARSDIFTTRHWIDSYGNSKLAQILHMSELQALLDQDDSTDLKVVSVCPGFVSSSMVPDRPLARFISRFFFSCRAATLAPLAALLDPAVQGGQWLTNFRVVWTSPAHPLFRSVTSLCIALGLRDLFMSLLASPQVILFQNSSYDVHCSTTSREAKDRTLSGAFYAWCLQATDKYRKSTVDSE